jgi:hypothetical protein
MIAVIKSNKRWILHTAEMRDEVTHDSELIGFGSFGPIFQGHSQPEMASIMQVSIGTVNRDFSYLRQQAKPNIRKYIDERLPEEYEKCLVTLYSKISKSKLLMLLCLVFSLSLIAKYIKFSIDNKC